MRLARLALRRWRSAAPRRPTSRAGSTISATLSPWRGAGVGRGDRHGAAVRGRASARLRFHPRLGLRLHPPRAADGLAGGFRSALPAARVGAGQCAGSEAGRSRAARMSGGTAAPITCRPANGRRSACVAGRSTSPGARRRTAILRRTAAIEFVVAAGSGGGRGWIAVDDLEIVPRTPPPDGAAASPGARRPRRSVRWRSTATGAPPGRRGRRPRSTLDLGYQREFGGLVLRWAEGRATRPLTMSRFPPTGGRGRASGRSAAATAAPTGYGWRRAEARYVRIRASSRAPAARSPRSRSARSPSAPAPMASSPRSPPRRRAAPFRAASSASRITGRWSRRRTAARAA